MDLIHKYKYYKNLFGGERTDNILIVEDNIFVSEHLVSYFTNFNGHKYNVFASKNLQETNQMIHDIEFDLILCDIVLGNSSNVFDVEMIKFRHDLRIDGTGNKDTVVILSEELSENDPSDRRIDNKTYYVNRHSDIIATKFNEITQNRSVGYHNELCRCHNIIKSIPPYSCLPICDEYLFKRISFELCIIRNNLL
jgi:CheY-like chemotaxis protein